MEQSNFYDTMTVSEIVWYVISSQKPDDWNLWEKCRDYALRHGLVEYGGFPECSDCNPWLATDKFWEYEKETASQRLTSGKGTVIMSQYTVELLDNPTGPISHFLFFVKDGNFVVGTGEICNQNTPHEFFRYAGHSVPGGDRDETIRLFCDSQEELLTKVIDKYTFILNDKPVLPYLYRSQNNCSKRAQLVQALFFVL